MARYRPSSTGHAEARVTPIEVDTASLIGCAGTHLINWHSRSRALLASSCNLLQTPTKQRGRSGMKCVVFPIAQWYHTCAEYVYEQKLLELGRIVFLSSSESSDVAPFKYYHFRFLQVILNEMQIYNDTNVKAGRILWCKVGKVLCKNKHQFTHLGRKMLDGLGIFIHLVFCQK